ncbi:MAG TPA: dihydrofolate reductase family protein [Propionibacteriaceae bacterium]|nr:dihydrofolate reductase family protein [Propionibacteriaceae bacterium]
MRLVRYNVAASLDGYVAGPTGGFDWIPDDETVDFAAIFARVDTVLLGRRSYEVAIGMDGELPWGPDTRVFVFSSTLRPEAYPDVTVVADHAVERVQALREEAGEGEIWLFGGGELFRTLLVGGQVDRVEVTVVPVLLGGGTPLLAVGATTTKLSLLDTHTYPSGMVGLTYEVVR